MSTHAHFFIKVSPQDKFCWHCQTTGQVAAWFKHMGITSNAHSIQETLSRKKACKYVLYKETYIFIGSTEQEAYTTMLRGCELMVHDKIHNEAIMRKLSAQQTSSKHEDEPAALALSKKRGISDRTIMYYRETLRAEPMLFSSIGACADYICTIKDVSRGAAYRSVYSAFMRKSCKVTSGYTTFGFTPEEHAAYLAAYIKRYHCR